MNARRYKYTPHPCFPGGMPRVEIHLSHRKKSVSVPVLVDSGSALNVLPFDMGLELGLTWETQTYPLNLEGILKGIHAHAVLLSMELAPYPSVEMAFAWVNKPSSEISALLGQVNFFQEFNVFFYGHQGIFEITPRTG